MQNDELAALKASPEFRAIVRKRTASVSVLSTILAALFFGNILFMSLASDLAAISFAGLNVGIIFSIVLTMAGGGVAAAYALWANRSLDPDIEAVRMRLQVRAQDGTR